ncbi:TFIIH subunit Tfb4/p34 [Dipodascopsis uninucleata]
MNAVDSTSQGLHTKVSDTSDESSSLLVLVLDTSPKGWAILANEHSLTIQSVVATLCIFLNSHLALNHANEVAVVAAHVDRVKFLYPAASKLKSEQDEERKSGVEESTMYRQFRVVNESVINELQSLLESTASESLSEPSSSTTLISGALSTALAYINRIANSNSSNSTVSIYRAKIMIVSICSDLATQYVPLMNCIFAAQKLKIPIDICKLGTDEDTVFLQQAADTTNGVYLRLVKEQAQGLLQYLVTAFLPDRALRKNLILPSQSSVDFRAACFCHKRVVDIGYVCNICLSIFCEPPADGSCTICDTVFDSRELAELLKKPVVVTSSGIRKKSKKKKRKDGKPAS